MTTDYAIISRNISFFPSGTNPLYIPIREIKIKKESIKVTVKPVKNISETIYSRDATIKTREKGKGIDIFI